MQNNLFIVWVRRHRIILLLSSIILISVFLRFYNLGTKSLWLDEAESLRESSLSIQGMVSSANQGPLYFLMLHGWISLFGTGETAIRSLSAILGVLAVVVVYLAGSALFNKRVGLFGAFLSSFGYFPIAYAQDTRAYSLLLLLSALSYWLFFEILKRDGKRFYVAYIIASILLVYTHVYGLFIIASQVLFFLIFFTRYKAQLLKYLATIGILILIAVIPTGLLLKNNIADIARNGFWIQKPGISTILTTFTDFSGTGSHKLTIFTIFVVLTILGVFVVNTSQRKSSGIGSTANENRFSWHIHLESREKIFLLLSWLFIPIAIPFIESQIMTPIYQAKYVIGAYPALCLLAANGLNNIKWRWILFPLLVATVVLSAIGLQYFYKYDLNEQWREAEQLIEPKLQPNDVLVFSEGWYSVPFNYYYKGTAKEAGVNSVEDAVKFVDAANSSGAINQERLWLLLVDGKPQILKIFAEAYGEQSIELDQEFVGVTVILCDPSGHTPSNQSSAASK
jgi:mannosyltransferase